MTQGLTLQTMASLPNTLGLVATAPRMVCITHPAQLPALSALVAQEASPPLILGAGSNVVLPARVENLVVLPQLRGVRLLHTTPQARVVEVMAGENWHDWVTHSLAQGWYGLENLALIPGTVGAAPVQNIGAYGVELHQRLHSVLAWHIPEARLHTLTVQACHFAYRHSRFKAAPPGQWLIVAVRFSLPRPWQAVLTYPALQRHLRMQADPHAIYATVCAIRRAKLPDPAQLGNVGSFFKNPVVTAAQYARLQQAYPGLPAWVQPDGNVKLAAGWLIEQAGWKGRRLGCVGMHAQQALVLVNYGQAYQEDVLSLEQAVRDAVQSRFGVILEREPVLYGKRGTVQAGEHRTLVK